MGQQRRQGEDLLLAPGQVAGQLVLALPQDGEPLAAQIPVLGVGQPELHVLPHGEAAEDAPGLGGQHHAPAGPAMAAQAGNVLTVQSDPAMGGGQ